MPTTAGMAFVPKSRRTKFDLTLRILDLNNVPLVSGSSFIKWHLPTSTAAEHRGRTPKAPINDHRVSYDYVKNLPVRLTVGKDGMLQECAVVFEVCQEYGASGRGERIVLGKIKCNLAEYVDLEGPSSPVKDKGEPQEEGIVRRYLMQDSKINSTLKVGILMRYVDGAKDYYAPPLRTAPVFGGIAGIISNTEPATGSHAPTSDSVDGPSMPSLSANSREVGEMQDMYRRTLAAYWASQPGELKADECIEDIFAGGDGWGKDGPPPSLGSQNQGTASGTSTSTPDSDVVGKKEGHRRGGSGAQGSFGVKSGHETGRYRHGFGKKAKVPRKAPGELDEFDIREDLRSWRIGEAVSNAPLN